MFKFFQIKNIFSIIEKMYLTKEELANEIRRVAVNTRYPVYNVNTGTVPSSITTYLEYIVALRVKHGTLGR
jgi:hypothetical protein